MKETAINIIEVCRPKQWLKNTFILLPLFFGGLFFELYSLQQTILTAVAFCFIASAIYCLNDIMDVDEDRQHPQKKNRPLASGRISVKTEYIIFFSVSLIGFTLLFLIDIPFSAIAVVGGYYLLNIAYCLILKRMAIIDIFVVSLDYVLRIIIGGIVADVALSPWIVILTFLLALFIVFAKRYGDLEICENTGNKHPRTTYNKIFLIVLMSITASVTIVSYIMYTISSTTPLLYITSIFVFFGLIRYLYLSLVMNVFSSPTAVVFSDRPLQACLIIWVLSYIIILYVL